MREEEFPVCCLIPCLGGRGEKVAWRSTPLGGELSACHVLPLRSDGGGTEGWP